MRFMKSLLSPKFLIILNAFFSIQDKLIALKYAGLTLI